MVIVRIWDGLGNQMFQYAYARALKARGRDVRLDLNKAYDQTFLKYKYHAKRDNIIQNYRITLPDIDVSQYKEYSYLERDTLWKKAVFFLAGHFLWKYRFYEEKEQKYNLKSANVSGNCYVKGWFQSEHYFSDIRGILLREFVPKEKIRISRKIRDAINNEESISIHVRRGDYVRINNVVGKNYYRKAINIMRKKYKNPIFLVFSDDMTWAKSNLEIGEKCIWVNEDRKLQDYEELFIMSRCKSNIIANSTFSWWAAWLNRNEDKCVVAPQKWFPTQGEITPKDWILI